MAELLQFVFSGLTVGAIYALVALGFTLIYKASDIINFAQGEFVMLGGMTTVFVAQPAFHCRLLRSSPSSRQPPSAWPCIVLRSSLRVGPRSVALIMITIGASIFLRGIAQIVFDRRFHSLPPLLGADPIQFGGAAILPQSLVVLATARLSSSCFGFLSSAPFSARR